jgi:hypothetical protein
MLKKHSFIWTEEQTTAFNLLKHSLTTALVMALPNFSLPFTLETNACGTGIGAVLMQQGKPIAYFSKTLGIKNAAMSTYDKEALAILEALKRWRHYLPDSDLVIKTDQKSLKYITDQKVAEGVQHKLLLKLLQFNYTVEYKKGKENKVANALSRRDCTLLPVTLIQPTWVASIENSYLHDPSCQELIQKLSICPTGHPPITLHAGLLRYKGRLYIGKDAELKQQIMHSLHASAIGGHSGVVASYQRMKRLF